MNRFNRHVRTCAVLAVLCLATLFPVPLLAGETPVPDLDRAFDHLFAVTDPARKAAFNPSTVAAIASFVAGSNQSGNYAPNPRKGGSGAYDVFDLDVGLSRLIQYQYNPEVPGQAVNPSSLRRSRWTKVEGQGPGEIPRLWERLDDLKAPVVVRGVQHDIITPDTSSGAYYEYDLNRSLILYKEGKRTVLLSVSEQIGTSSVGRKAAIVGPDEQWNYLYGQETGLNRTGLGWVDSYIYNYASVCVYLAEPGAKRVRYAVFQWLRAGWSGINMVRASHIKGGMTRFSRDFRQIIASSRLPSPETLAATYARLRAMPRETLAGIYRPVLQDLLRTMEKDPGSHPKSLLKEVRSGGYLERMDVEALADALMVEILKLDLGRRTALEKSILANLRS